MPFTKSELVDALHKAHDSATWLDNIHYQMLKHLPDSASSVRQIFNDLWNSGNFPKSWCEATVIPLPKPSKELMESTSYRPITLTSCLCKTFDRMVNERLVYYLESNGIINRCQSGFRKHRGTVGQLVCFESFKGETLVKWEHAVAILFDLEKGYDMTWRYGMMQVAFETGLAAIYPKRK